MDTFSMGKRSEIMRRVKSKETELEKSFRKILWHQGVRYRKNNAKYFGKPDLLIKSRQSVIFIDSCFWHGCVDHVRMPKSNKEYWVKKIDRNIKRDKEVNDYYINKGWKIIRIWEHDIKKSLEETLNRTMLALNSSLQ